MNAATVEMVVVAPAEYMTIKGAAAALGMTELAIRKRIERAAWVEGHQWRRSPDGRIWISMKGVKAWVETATA